MGEQKTLNPGTYCLGLHIYDSQVKLNPGTYIIKDGPLTIGHNSSVVGDGVTFVFTGEDSLLYTYEEVAFLMDRFLFWFFLLSQIVFSLLFLITLKVQGDQIENQH